MILYTVAVFVTLYGVTNAYYDEKLKECRVESECGGGFCYPESCQRNGFGKYSPLNPRKVCRGKLESHSRCYCGESRSCKSGKCTCGFCGKVPNGNSCARDVDCQSGYCKDPNFLLGCSGGRCTDKMSLLPDGRYCNGNEKCRSLQCTCNVCGRKLSRGYKCSTNDNCSSRRCSGGWTGTFGCRGKCD